MGHHIHKNVLCFLAAGLIVSTLVAQSAGTGVFDFDKDIGSPAIRGATSFDPKDDSYLIRGAGYNIWFSRDEFHYTCTKLRGDFILTAHFAFVGEGKEAHRKTGWMVRASDADSAAHMTATVHGDGLTALQWRRFDGAAMRDPEDELFATMKHASIIQLERKGRVFIMRAAEAGKPLEEVGRTDAADLPDEVLAGIFICSHNPDITEQAVVTNVQIVNPRKQ